MLITTQILIYIYIYAILLRSACAGLDYSLGRKQPHAAISGKSRMLYSLLVFHPRLLLGSFGRRRLRCTEA